ncbi:popy Class I histocompatibility antigen, A-1 alpha chain-like isoform X2 [Marmota marmota marmota]|uniref:popy Class I histocompatibility antigen, A-1 alpha chain-like isoform X2 n=1 Tax=Marmota marmota marmota TaxID=9994 RepID=UPI002091F8BE|nr:popy Class I histocompatibility antigen, A-1 alpha chain-like isoform X2 [Marmota marmota marmota]
MALVDAQYWETETQKQRAWEKVQQVEMWTVMGYHNQSGGTHSAQRMFGCEIREDGRSSSFWQFGFDGQDHLSLDLETLSWVSAEPVAVRTKRWWEMERCYAEYDKAYLESLCLISLHRYLELGSQSLTRIGKAQTAAAMQRVSHILPFTRAVPFDGEAWERRREGQLANSFLTQN